MAQYQSAAGAQRNDRPSPNAHSTEVQEAKRREKMQAHSSSHRTSGTTHHAEADKAAARS